MRRSTDRIITTHAGSLPRPDALREAWAKPGASDAEIDALLKSARRRCRKGAASRRRRCAQ